MRKNLLFTPRSLLDWKGRTQSLCLNSPGGCSLQKHLLGVTRGYVQLGSI